jgi:3-oxoacyl-[acyl-carrier protein] reductase
MLIGRSVIITGASQGMGKTIARACVRAGANVFLIARGEILLNETTAELQTDARPGQVVAAMAGDVGDPLQCQAMVNQALSCLPNLTALVNNAGIYGPMGLVEENDWDSWVETMRVNCFGAVLMTRKVLPTFKAQKYGKIITLSGGGATAPMPRLTAYASAKAAVVRFCESVALETREQGIDVNTVAPGPLNTRLLDEVLAAGPDKVGRDFFEKSIKQRETGGAQLEKGAALCVFLASAASDGITGRLLSAVWDDWAHLPERRETLERTDIFTLRRIVPEDRREQWRCA